MKKIFLIALASTFFMNSSLLAQAAEVDMAQLLCADFIANEDEIPFTMFWLDGYASAVSDNTVMTDEWMQEFSMHMVSYCTDNPDMTILDGLEAMED